MIDKCDKAIGLDISDSSIKAVCLSSDNKLEDYGIIDLIPGSTDQDVVMAVKKIISGDCQSCEINVGLRGNEVLTKLMEIEAADSVELTNKVEEEIKTFLPVMREEVEVSWEVLKVEEKRIKLLIIIIPKEVLLRYQRIVEGVGLSIKNFEINALTLKRAMGKKTKGRVMLIDVHAEEIDVEVYKEDMLIVDQTLPYGGRKITQLLTHKLNVNVEEAEKYKRENQIDDEQYEHSYKPFVEDLVTEINRIISMAELEYGTRPEKILITGGDFAQKKLGENIKKSLADVIEVELVISDDIYPGMVEISEADKLRIGNAVGLALK